MTMRTDTVFARRSGGSASGRGVRLILLISLLVSLAIAATGCQSILTDMLAGDACGDHSVCGSKAAAAGVGAAVAGAAAAYLQRKEDDPEGPWPWEKDSAEMDAELEELAGDEKTRLAEVKTATNAAGGHEAPAVTPPAEEQPEQPAEPTEEPQESTPESEEQIETDGDGASASSDQGEGGESDSPVDKSEEQPAKSDKDKVKSPATTYVPVGSAGDVTILMDPKTQKIAVSDGTYIGGKDKNGYWITGDNKIVIYNSDTGKATVSDGQFTASHEGTTYTVTNDNKVLSYDQKGNIKISDGHFTATRDATTYAVTRDNKVIEYDQMTGGFKVTDGHFTATHEGTIYSVTKDNKILEYDQASGNVKVSDGHFTATRDGTAYAVTKDNKILSYDEASGNIKVSDGHFTASREGTVYSATRDNKVLTYNQGSGDFKVSDGHYVLEREGSTTAFTKDNVAVEYDRDLHMVAVTTKGQRGELTLGGGRDGQFALDGSIKGSLHGTPTTYGVTAARYNLPETGGQGFAGGLSLEQKDFEFHAAYLREGQETQFSVDVRKEDWTVGFQRANDAKTYNLGYRDVKLGFEEGGGRTLTTAGYTRRF